MTKLEALIVEALRLRTTDRRKLLVEIERSLAGESSPAASYGSLLYLAGTADCEYSDVSIDKRGHVSAAASDTDSSFELSAESEAALAESIAEADRGDVVSAEELFRRLSR